MDVSAWLRRLGLRTATRLHSATMMPLVRWSKSLRELTADDLIGIGVASIGHRRKLLAAVA